MNAEQFPRSAKAWENLAEACAAGGKKELAAFYLARSIEIDPGSPGAAEKLRALEGR